MGSMRSMETILGTKNGSRVRLVAVGVNRESMDVVDLMDPWR